MGSYWTSTGGGHVIVFPAVIIRQRLKVFDGGQENGVTNAWDSSIMSEY